MMSLIFALKAAVNGPTGPRAILFDGLGRTKRRRRQSGQLPTPGFSRRRGGRAPCGHGYFSQHLPLHPQRRVLIPQPPQLLTLITTQPPGRSPRAAFSALSQWRNVTSEIPRSLANLRWGLSPSCARRIASRRNSSGYGGLVLGT